MNYMKPSCKQYFRSIICLCFILIAIVDHSFAQAKKTACPVVRVTGPAEVSAGDLLVITANVRGGDAGVTPTYNWSVSAGTISSGQGTPTITVDLTGTEGQSVTATVDVGGYPRECQTSGSYTTSVMKKAVARKLTEYRKIKLADEQAMLDFFTIELQNDPMAMGYIISYAGIKSKPNTAGITAKRAKNYIVDQRGIAGDRIITVDGGFRQEEITELYIVPQGAMVPSAQPTVDPSARSSKPTTSVKKVKVKTVSK